MNQQSQHLGVGISFCMRIPMSYCRVYKAHIMPGEFLIKSGIIWQLEACPYRIEHGVKGLVVASE